MKPDPPPPTRRSFADWADERNYLYDKVLYWLYGRHEPRKAAPFAGRLKRLLKKHPEESPSITGEEARSLIAETEGDLTAAIEHREREIALMRKFHDLVRGTPHEDAGLHFCGYDDLSDRLDLLAILYHDAGDTAKALATLEESRQLCEQHGIRFDGQDIVDEYLTEQKAKNGFRKAAPRRKTGS